MEPYIVIAEDFSTHYFPNLDDARNFLQTQNHGILYEKQTDEFYLEISRKYPI
jgi:hypothetical protein